MKREKGKESIRDAVVRLDSALGHQLERIWELAQQGIHGAQRSKDGHQQGTAHCVAVEQNLSALISDESKGTEFSATELFVLSAAAALHDIGRAGDSLTDHGHISMRELRQRAVDFGLDDGQAEAVGYVVKPHNDGDLGALPAAPYPIGVEEVRVRLLAALLKLADALHTDYHRVSDQVSRLGGQEPEDNPKTRFRMRVRGWRFNDQGNVELLAVPKDWEDDGVINTGFEMIQSELAPVIPTLRDAGLPWEMSLAVDTTDLEDQARLEVKEKLTIERAFVGMDYFREADADHYLGRNEIARALQRQVMASPLTLLVGDSGVGKTSLIYAGLFPLLHRIRWRVVCLRPLDDPDQYLVGDLWHQLADLLPGNPPPGLSLVDSLDQASKALGDQRLLIVLDQAEDVVRVPLPKMLDGLKQALVAVLAGRFQNERLLVSYRAEDEGRLGPFLHDVAGSARELPRTYLVPLIRDGALVAFRAGFADARIGVDDAVIESVVSDLETLSPSHGVYPPYLQMVGEVLCERARSTNGGILTQDLYEAEGGCEEIVSGYLLRRLEEFGAQRDIAWKVAVALVRSTGVKEQRTLDELASETRLDRGSLDAVLSGLVDKRIVRSLAGARYEIMHDLLAQKVLEGLQQDEIEAKEIIDAFRLAVKAFRTDRVTASRGNLDRFYRHHQNLRIGTYELEFLLASEYAGESSSWFVRFESHRYCRWIALASSIACVHMLNSLVKAVADKETEKFVFDLRTPNVPNLYPRYSDIIVALFQAANMDAQRRFVAALGEMGESLCDSLYREHYAIAPIETDELLQYLQKTVRVDQQLLAKKTIAYRILEHYRVTYPYMLSTEERSDEENSQAWMGRGLQTLLEASEFQDLVYGYLTQLCTDGRTAERSLGQFVVAVFGLLSRQDEKRAVTAMWDIVEGSKHVDRVGSSLLEALTIGDPQRTLEKIVTLADQGKLAIIDHISLLERVATPETDSLLIGALDRYAQGSRLYRSLHSTKRDKFAPEQELIQAIGRRQLQQAIPLLSKVVLRRETQNTKLVCIDAMESIGVVYFLDVFVKLLDDHSERVRDRASSSLCTLGSHQDILARKIAGSLEVQMEQAPVKRARHSEVVKRKINTLWRLRTTDPHVIGVVEQIEQSDSDESVRKTATRVLTMLRNLQAQNQ